MWTPPLSRWPEGAVRLQCLSQRIPLSPLMVTSAPGSSRGEEGTCLYRYTTAHTTALLVIIAVVLFMGGAVLTFS